MDMRVELNFLTPSMQHAEEANFRAEVLWIAGDFEQSFRTGAEQKAVEDLPVLQNQRRQLMGWREDYVGGGSFLSSMFVSGFADTGAVSQAQTLARVRRFVRDGGVG